MNQPLLEVSNLVAGYVPGIDILKGVSLYVDQGEIVSIIGPNGAGKSTLARALFGLVTIRSGSICFDGQELRGLKPSEIVGLGISYVPQTRNVFPNLTVRENLEIGGSLLRSGVAEAMERVLDIFPDLRARTRQMAGTLSGGQRQMLAMGRALMLAPRLLVLDEPSAGLSPQMMDVVFAKVQDINRTGCAVLMVEQNARRALAMSHRGYVLDMGENAIEDTGPALLQNPRVIDLYLGQLGRADETNIQ